MKNIKNTSKGRNMKKLLVLVVCVALMVGCGTPVNEERVVIGDGWDDVIRFIDEEAGVVCWLYRADRSAGLSCLPLSQTKLDIGR